MIPFVDLKQQYRSIRNEVLAAIENVLENAAFALGPAVADFEQRFASYVGTKHAIGVSSGTSALHLALLAAGVGPGDEVIAPAMTFVATVAAIDYTGARPVLVDVDPVRYTMDPAQVELKMTPRTKAIVPVHLYGQPADMDPILATAKRHDLVVIEDAAQSHGAEYKGRRCGAIGDMACFSFYPAKNLGAYGEGGAVTTDRDDLADTVRVLRDWGQTEKYHHNLKGFNYRMEGLQGAVLGVKLNHIEPWTEARRRAAALYDELLQDGDGLVTPKQMSDARHVYHVYAILVKDRDTVRQKLDQAGIGSGIHYPIPVHLQKCFAELGYGQGDFPVAERVADQELSLPMYAELTEEQIRQVAMEVQKDERRQAGGEASAQAGADVDAASPCR